MEEAVVDFDKWILEQQTVEIEYWAVYNDQGIVTGIYPGETANDKSNKIKIDRVVAERIQDGTTQLHLCHVDVAKKEFFASYEKEIDNVLHRVSDKKWSTLKYFDFYIEYCSQDAIINLALSKKYHGTRSDILIPSSDFFNDAHSEILLLLTDYNDPNILYYSLTVKLNELQGVEKQFSNIVLPEKFSVYTHRFFDTYILDIK